MISIKQFVFNPVQVNTYILWDETSECIIIDAGCYGKSEEEIISNYIKAAKLHPVMGINTHAHVDHILGNNYIKEMYKIPIAAHEDSDYFMKNSVSWAEMLGFKLSGTPTIDIKLKDGEKITFGQSEVEVLSTPGHSAGSISILSRREKFVITGDVLFAGSIGRTDLPTGDYSLIKRSIKDILYKLGDEYRVLPGHGGETRIGDEKRNNPFINAET